MDLWPHQLYAHDEVTAAITGGIRRICLTSPTGGGKSVIICRLIEWGQSRLMRPVLYTNRKLLIEQLQKVLTAHGIAYGVRAAGHEPELSRDVQISSMPTEAARVLRGKQGALHNSKLVIVDEAHLFKLAVAQEIQMRHLAAGAAWVGVTATPIDIGHMYDRLIVAGKTSDLRKCGALVPAVHFAPDEPDMRRFKASTKTGEFQEGDNIKAIMTKTVWSRVYENWRSLNPEGLPTILFGPGVAESLWFAEQFRSRGVRAAHVDGENCWIDGEHHGGGSEIREQMLADVRTGRIQVVCNRFVLREGIDCLDCETEVLTKQGWKGAASEWADGELVYSLNKNTHKAELVPADNVMFRKVRNDEKMISVTGQHTNIRVTSGHRIHVKYAEWNHRRLSKTWRVMLAGELLATKNSEIYLPISCEGDFAGAPLTNDEIKFIGWFLTDGGWSRGKSHVLIYQSEAKMPYVKEIRKLLLRLGYQFREYVKGPPKCGFSRKDGKTFLSHTFSVRRNLLHGHLACCLDKDFPKSLDNMTRRQFFVLFREMCKGDGSFAVSGGKQPTLGTARKSVADAISGMAVVRGYACNVLAAKTPMGKPFWYIRIRSSKYIGIRFTDSRASQVTAEPADGEQVWCVTNRNDTLITRRRGKIAIIGNCPELRHCVFATVMGLQSYLQAGGRALRKSPGKESVVIQDHGGNNWRNGSLNADRDWSMDFTQGQLLQNRFDRMRNGLEPEPITCPQCKACRSTGATCPRCGYTMTRRSRLVIQENGELIQVHGDLFSPRKVSMREDTIAKWERVYWRCKNSKKPKSFRQAEALFLIENGYYPPRDIPYMPTRDVDFGRKVADVPYQYLVPKDRGNE